MDKELKIAVTIFLVFLVFGIASYFNQGSFATPVFMNQFIFVILALLFYVMNLKEQNSVILLVYFFVSALGLIIDEFSMGYLAESFENNVFLDLSRSLYFSLLFIVFYFGFSIFSIFYLYKNTRLKWLLIMQVVLVLATVYFLMFSELKLIYSVLYSMFLLSFVISVNRLLKSDDKVISVLSYQFFLMVLLESLEYFL